MRQGKCPVAVPSIWPSSLHSFIKVLIGTTCRWLVLVARQGQAQVKAPASSAYPGNRAESIESLSWDGLWTRLFRPV